MCCKLWEEILLGEERGFGRRNALRGLVVSEAGLISWATLLAVFLFCLLIAVVFNVGRISNDKLQAQNAADSAAYSASLVQARSLNAITASNHMIGELMTLYSMHHAIGGQTLDNRDEENSFSVIALNIALWGADIAAHAAWLTSLPSGAGNRPEDHFGVDDTPRGEATVHDAKCVIKMKYIQEYFNHMQGSAEIAEGQILVLSIIFASIGQGMIQSGLAQQRAANMEMKALEREYNFITRLEDFALRLLPIKRRIPTLIGALWQYEKALAGNLPGISGRWRAMDAAKWTGEQNRSVAEALGFPSIANAAAAQAGVPSTVLPLVEDPTNPHQYSQLMRATYPWLQEWRVPVLVAFDLLARRSRASRFYEFYCDDYSLKFVREFREQRGVKLLVLVDMDASWAMSDKGTERWRSREESIFADKLFSVVGVARLERAPGTSAFAYFPKTNPKPIAAMAQAIQYNGNRPQRWEPVFGDYLSWVLGREAQPVDGWDTLNWTEGATEWKQGKDYLGWFPDSFRWFGGWLGSYIPFDAVWPPDLKLGPIGVPTPQVKLNWQAKLVPIATKNLPLRVPMIRDESMRDRMLFQALPGVLANQLGVEVIHQ